MSFQERLKSATRTAITNLLAERTADDHWIGQLSTSALSTATAVSALSAVKQNAKEMTQAEQEAIQTLIDGGIRWLTENTNDDGGWGDTRKSYSNIATTMLGVAAFQFANRTLDHGTILEKADEYIRIQGGLDGLRNRYGRDKTFAVPILANCAMAGTRSWKDVAVLPFEAACVPQKFYHLVRMPVVSYAIPALVAIGQAKFIHDPPWNPLTRMVRQASINRSLRVLERMQPASGGFLEAIPLTSFVVMGLATTGRSDHPVVRNGVRFIRESVLQDGSWPIDTNLATWTTTLAINSLASSLDYDPKRELRDQVVSNVRCIEWLLSCQHREVHPFTNSPPGGWGWTDLSGAVPDADDTPGALLALANIRDQGLLDSNLRDRICQAAGMGVRWLIGLQNRDDGWPTFCRGWGRLPFDRSGPDITAHCLRGLNAWKDHVDVPRRRIEKSIRRGLRYLERNQRPDGSWYPLWFGNQDHPDEENPVYGTAKVLEAYRDLNRLETNAARRGLKWLTADQNEDGSWGGGPSTTAALRPFFPDSKRGTIGTIEETALATGILLDCENEWKNGSPGARGVQWLVRAVESDCYRIDWPIGFYFAKLWYHERLYPQIFTVAALGKACSRISAASPAPRNT